MIFSYNWIQSFFSERLPKPEKLAHLLTLHSFEVEEVKKIGKDWIFDIDVTPNRGADCFSHFGIARECGVLMGAKFKVQKIKLRENKKANIKDFFEIKVRSKNDCLRYTGRAILGVEVKASPKYIQERLIACGLEPINNIVDAANYVMLELGQPLHAFDIDKISDSLVKGSEGKKEIIIRRAKPGEKIVALDDKTYKLDEDILIIADSEKPLAIAGIKGGKSTAIETKTKNIFLESANFNPVLIRQASKKLNLKTDASFRFEHGLDPNMTEAAVDRLAGLIQEIACPKSGDSSVNSQARGRIMKGRTDVYSKKVFPEKIKIDLRKVEKLLGVKITRNKIIKILKDLEIRVDGKGGSGKLRVEIPTWRPDINIEEDLIEEIGRIYGYEKLKPVFPRLSLLPSQRNEELVWQERIKDFLRTAGFSEVYNYSFISKKAGDYFGIGLVELENPFSEQFYYLRPNLMVNLLENINHNSKYLKKEKEIRIFELGTVFKKKGRKIEEKKMLSGMITGSQEDFYILKGVLDDLLQGLGISDKFYDDYQATSDNSQQIFWNPEKSAAIRISGGQEVGFIGELSSKALSQLGVKETVTAFEIDFDKLIKFCNEEQEYQAISKFPSAVRDIAILVPLRTKVADILNTINLVGGKLVRDVDLFDIYEGKELGEGRKNLAFHLVFQAQDRTLSGKEIDGLFQRIIEELEKNPDWEVRR